MASNCKWLVALPCSVFCPSDLRVPCARVLGDSPVVILLCTPLFSPPYRYRDGCIFQARVLLFVPTIFFSYVESDASILKYTTSTRRLTGRPSSPNLPYLSFYATTNVTFFFFFLCSCLDMLTSVSSCAYNEAGASRKCENRKRGQRMHAGVRERIHLVYYQRRSVPGLILCRV